MRILILAAVFGTTVLALQSDEKVYKVGDPGVTAPVLRHWVKPNYTGDAMRRKVSGRIVLAAVVKTDGTVRDDVQVIDPLDPDLDVAGVKVVKLWTFKPGTKDDKPVNVSVRIELAFSSTAVLGPRSETPPTAHTVPMNVLDRRAASVSTSPEHGLLTRALWRDCFRLHFCARRVSRLRPVAAPDTPPCRVAT
jgi:TonB family protein